MRTLLDSVPYYDLHDRFTELRKKCPFLSDKIVAKLSHVGTGTVFNIRHYTYPTISSTRYKLFKQFLDIYEQVDPEQMYLFVKKLSSNEVKVSKRDTRIEKHIQNMSYTSHIPVTKPASTSQTEMIKEDVYINQKAMFEMHKKLEHLTDLIIHSPLHHKKPSLWKRFKNWMSK